MRIQHSGLNCTSKVFSSQAVMQSVAIALPLDSASTVDLGTTSGSTDGS